MRSLGQSARLLLKSNTGNSKSIGGIIVGGRSIGYDRKVVMKAQLIITHPGSAHFDEVVSFMGGRSIKRSYSVIVESRRQREICGVYNILKLW